jgi:type IX secretion system PorP/SprF family membrane protein
MNLSAHTNLKSGSLIKRGLIPAVIEPDKSVYQEPKEAVQNQPSGHGIGAVIGYDRSGIFGQTTVSALYAYHLPMGAFTFSAGGSLGIVQYSINTADVVLDQQNDVAFGSNQSRLGPNLGLGLWLNHRHFFVGLSTDRLVPTKLSDGDGNLNLVGPHGYYTAGARLSVNDKISIVPSVMVRTAAPLGMSLDFTAKLIYTNQYWVAMSYRNQDAIALILGLSLTDQIDCSYSYDYTTSALSAKSQGSHELVLGYRLFKRNGAISSVRSRF